MGVRSRAFLANADAQAEKCTWNLSEQGPSAPCNISNLIPKLLPSGLTPCRQESYFHYLFGVEEEDYYGALDLRDGRTMLFMPRLPEAYAVSSDTLHRLIHNTGACCTGIAQLVERACNTMCILKYSLCGSLSLCALGHGSPAVGAMLFMSCHKGGA